MATITSTPISAGDTGLATQYNSVVTDLNAINNELATILAIAVALGE